MGEKFGNFQKTRAHAPLPQPGRTARRFYLQAVRAGRCRVAHCPPFGFSFAAGSGIMGKRARLPRTHNELIYNEGYTGRVCPRSGIPAIFLRRTDPWRLHAKTIWRPNSALPKRSRSILKTASSSGATTSTSTPRSSSPRARRSCPAASCAGTPSSRRAASSAPTRCWRIRPSAAAARSTPASAMTARLARTTKSAPSPMCAPAPKRPRAATWARMSRPRTPISPAATRSAT